ncbi:MAG: hypothetical protein Q8O53_03720 [Candidatus Moranbacteria bacterium]|nr:hypothetical protein [Candidatus Moranbacteria bacterium]
MSGEEIFCIDIRIGKSVRRSDVIRLLREEADITKLQLIRAECGMWNDTRLLRVYTANGPALVEYITANQELLGADTQCEINTSPNPAEDYSRFTPDYDLGFDERAFYF